MVGPFRGGRTLAAGGVPGSTNVFYVAAVNGGVWKTTDAGPWRPIFDDQPTQSIGAIAVAPSDPEHHLRRQRRGPAPARPLGRRRHLQVDRRGQDLDPPRAARRPADPADRRRPARPRPRVRGGARPPLRPERGARRVPLARRRQDLGEGAVQGREHRRVGVDDRSRAPRRRVRGAVGSRGRARGRTATSTAARRRALQVDRRRHHLAAARRAACPTRARASAHRRPSPPARSAATSTRPRTRRPTRAGIYRSDDAGATWTRTNGEPRVVGARRRLRRGAGRPEEPRRGLRREHRAMKSTDGGKTWTRAGAPGGDDYQNLWINPENPDVFVLVSDQGATITVNGGRDVEQLVQPADRAALPRLDGRPTSRTGSAAASRRAARCASRAAATTARSATASGGRSASSEYGYAAPDPLDPDVVYGAGRTRSRATSGRPGGSRTSRRSRSAGQYRAERTQPIVFSPAEPHVLYYAANVLFETADGGQTLARRSARISALPTPASRPASARYAARDGEAADARGAIYALAPSFKAADTIWAGTDDGLIEGHARRRRRLERHHAARAHGRGAR